MIAILKLNDTDLHGQHHPSMVDDDDDDDEDGDGGKNDDVDNYD